MEHDRRPWEAPCAGVYAVLRERARRREGTVGTGILLQLDPGQSMGDRDEDEDEKSHCTKIPDCDCVGGVKRDEIQCLVRVVREDSDGCMCTADRQSDGVRGLRSERGIGSDKGRWRDEAARPHGRFRVQRQQRDRYI